jgi:hypothetical protein
LPALQVEQVKRARFEAIYEDNAWKDKPDSNDQNGKSVIEFLFLKESQNPIAKNGRYRTLFKSGLQDYLSH